MSTENNSFASSDPFSNRIGLELVETGQNYAKAQMKITENHFNALGITHGGVYFSLADFAFGAATNYVENSMVTLNADIEFIISATCGDILTAISRESSSSSKIIRHQIEIHNQEGKLMCIIRCTGYRRSTSKLSKN